MVKVKEQPWAEVRDGYGFEPVSDTFKKEACCCVCQDTRNLWTNLNQNQPDKVYTPRQYAEWKRKVLAAFLSGGCYCRSCAYWYYKD